MPRFLLILGTLSLIVGCGSDGTVSEPDATEIAVEDTEAAAPDAMSLVSEADTTATAAVDSVAHVTHTAEVVDLPNVGSMERPLKGEAVCEELEAALLAMRINAYDLDLYAAQPVIDELRENTTFRDPETGENQPDEVAAWVEEDVPGYHCSLSAGGDAWYRVRLVELSGGRGDYATGIEITTSYAEGGP